MKRQPSAPAPYAVEPGTPDHSEVPLTAERSAEHVSAEESALPHLDFLRAITDNLGEGVCALDLAGYVTFMNPAAEHMLGWTAAELLGKDLHATIHFQSADGQPFPRERCPLLQALRTGQRQRVEADTFTRQDGSMFSVAYISSPILTDGVITGAVLAFHDTSADRDLVEALRRSEREAASRASQLLAIFESMADAVIVYDRDGSIMHSNAADAELFPADAAPPVDRRTIAERDHLFTLMDEKGRRLPVDQWPSARVLRGEVLRGAHAEDLFLRTTDGHTVVLNASGAPIRDAEGAIVGGVLIGRDVTQRRRLEQQTHAALTALMAMAEALVSSDWNRLDSSLASAQSVAQRLAELTRAVMRCERVGVHLYDLETQTVRSLAVAGLTEEQAHLRTFTARMNIPRGTVERLQSGEVIAVDLTQAPYDRWANPLGTRSLLLAPVMVGGPILGDISIDFGPIEHNPTPEEFALAGAIAKLAAQIIERERLAREREEARANALASAETTRRMDEFLSIAAHELKTPVTNSVLAVTLALDTLRARILQAGALPDLPDALVVDTLQSLSGLLERAEGHLELLSRLVVDLLDVTRIREGKLVLRLAPCNLATLLREIVEEQRQLAPGRRIDLYLPSRATLPPIALVDADRIRQVITNYLSNALKYSRDTTPVRVRLRITDNWVRLSVRDAGPGIPTAEQRRVWECCYRVEGIQALSGASGGLGLGLHISRTIIEQHQGHVGLRSAEGHGATFWFALQLMREVS